MKRSIYWKRLLGLLLAAALFTTQTGFTFVVSFAVEEVGRQLPSFASSELTVVEPVESAQSTETPAEEPETPGESLGVEVVERPIEPVKESPPVGTNTPQPEATEAPSETPEASEPQEPDSTQGPEESAVPEESWLPVQQPEASWEMETLPEIVERPPEADLMLLSEVVTHMHLYRLGYGVDLRNNDNVTLDGKYFKSGEFAFAVETTETGTNYGHRNYNQYLMPLIGEWGADRYTFCIFPSETQVGRIPDQEFEDWYLYPYGVKVGEEDDSRSWQYGDLRGEGPAALVDRMRPMKEYLVPYGEDDPLFAEETSWSLNSYTTYGEWGDRWDNLKYYDDKERFMDEGGEYHYNYAEFTEEDDEFYSNPVSFVGRWVPSSESRAADMEGSAGLFTDVDKEATKIDTYAEPIAGKSIEECEKIEFDRDTREYWLRVATDVDSLDLLLNTHEIYLDYHDGRAECPISVTSTFGGQATDCVNVDADAGVSNLSSEMLPKAKYNAYGTWVPSNSIDDPAHARWVLKGIALHPSQGGENTTYNDIQVTITAPNGEDETTYIFHVQRLQEPAMTQAYGNTPFGMILRDPEEFWGSDSVANKQAAMDYFEENHRFRFPSDDGASDNQERIYYPQGDNNNGGAIYHGVYSTTAWLGENIDLDPTAIVVYQDAAFLDPGISIVDGEGKAVPIGSGSVTRTLKLRQGTTLSAAGVGVNEGTECWYADGQLQTTEVKETLRKNDGTDQIDLRGLNVLPGVYALEYAYTDPVSGKIYDSTGQAFTTDEGRATSGNYTRTVVVLPTPGDVDMDGAVTSADAVFLNRQLRNDSSNRLTYNGKLASGDSAAALFVYRVCDVDQDGVVTVSGTDQAVLEALPNPQLTQVYSDDSSTQSKTKVQSDYFYIPLPAGDQEDKVRTALKEEGDSVEGAKLSLVYLGKEGGRRQDAGYTVNPTGPWGNNNMTDGVTLQDTFWMGVQMTEGQYAALLREPVTTFTFSLVYDSRYVEPAVVLSSANWQEGAGKETLWQNMMRLYNLAGGQTVWNTGYNFTGAAGYDKNYTPHYSAAILPLESSTAADQAGRESPLKKLVFSVSYNSGDMANLYKEGEAWLFAAPFTLIRHPYGQKEIQLVELGASMEDVTLIGALDAGGTVKAYSTQARITGNSTRNLRDQIHYTAAGVPIPLGADKTEVYDIYNEAVGGSSSTQRAVYSTAFRAQYGRQINSEGELEYAQTYGTLVGELPPGITYDGSSLSGTPEQAGTYEFRIGGNPFRMIVEKASLHFWADEQSSYYGQPEFRGAASNDFTFSYEIRDILSIDQARAAASNGTILLDGDGEHLAALIAEDSVAPTFTAVNGTVAVTSMTDRGNYPINCQSMPLNLKNYKLEYVEGKSLQILPRPFRVTQIADGTNVSEVVGADGKEVGVLFNDGGTAKRGVPASLGRGARGFLAELPGDGIYLGRPLTNQSGYLDGVLMPGDSLNISYTAEFVQNERDLEGVAANAGSYTLEDGNLVELRNVSVGQISVVGGTNSGNYNLIDDDPVRKVVEDQVTGTVRRRRIIDIAIRQLPPMEYQYGDQLTRSNELHFYIQKEIDQQEGVYDYSEQGVAQLGVHVCWATPEDVAADRVGSLPYRTGQTFTLEYHGARLCLWVDSVDEAGNATIIKRYSDEILTVSARTLTLTANRTQRFYGEENGELAFTYDPLQLASVDRQGRNLTGAGKELEEVLAHQNYTPPAVTAIDARDVESEAPREVTRLTACNGSYAVRIKGAACDNYIFEYTYTDPTGKTEIREDYGASAFLILPRLIVVERVTTTKDLAFAYADTHRINTEITEPGGRTAPLGLADVELGLPEHSEVVTRYYPRGGRNDDKPLEMYATYAENAKPVLPEDENRLYFTYTATLVSTDGPDYMNHVDFSKGYFNMEGKDEKRYPVQVSNLWLTGEAAFNYNLVFRDNSAAIQALPQQTIAVQGIDPEKVSDKNYYVPNISTTGGEEQGMGTVALRPIESIRILSTGKLDYTYGEVYSPNLVGADSRSMRIAIQYSIKDDNYDGNPYIGEVALRVSGYDEEGKAVTSFDDRSLVIYWLGPDDTPDQVVEGTDHILRFQESLSVSPHNGARLMVTGKRGGQTELIKSEPTGTDQTLKVAPRPLTLTAVEVKRCYGEPNPQANEYDFTFSASQLSQQDQDALSALGLSAPYGHDALAALAGRRGLDYTRPKGTTTAAQESPVLNDGRGSYPIPLSGGSLPNYTLSYEQGGLRVYPRPVRIASFESDYENKPIYTIFASTTNKLFNTNVTTQSSEDQPSAVMARPQGDRYVFSDGTSLVVSGEPVYGSDILTLQIQVNFWEMNSLDGASSRPHNVRVDNAHLVSGTAGANNYILVENAEGHAAIANPLTVGAVKLRSISTIKLDREPRNLSYTYGEPLDLSGLRVILNYDVIEGETPPDPIVVSYQGPDQFAQYGLYVNYYDSNTIPAESAWASIMEDYPAAVTGDHLTIAPTHESVAAGEPFSANGKYLIVSAQRHQDQEPSEPKIVSTPITVNPRRLSFTLSAEDKTYNGNTQAAGTLTFTNAYDQAGITDMVYPITGAKVETEQWGSLAVGSESFNAHVEKNGYAFSTGTYVPAGAAPLGENYDLDWIDGYRYGTANTLKFEFLQPNVVYAGETGRDYYGALDTEAVQVTDIYLGGPDKANYTIVDHVTQANEGTAPGYEGSTLPRATIHKANRSALPTGIRPQVEVDPHTNIVRVLYGQSLAAVGDSGDTYNGELHFEYTLQYEASDAEGTYLRHWAGEDGSSHFLWDDGAYFGGEAVKPQLPQGYVPKEEDIPKEDSSGDSTLKGQVYAWSNEDKGFVPDADAYPNGAVWPGYELYKTSRTQLPRDTVFWPLVRLAETHNYNASPALSSVAEYEPQMVQNVTQAWGEMLTAGSETGQSVARQKMAAAVGIAMPVLEPVIADARAAAQAETALLMEIGEGGAWPENWSREASRATKTYLQRLDAISVKEVQGAGEAPNSDNTFVLPTLEAVWFTDLLEYPKKEYMDAALRNSDPVRYRGYAWDSERSAELDFDGEGGPVSLKEAFEVSIKKTVDGQEVEELLWVNKQHTAQIYVDNSTHSGSSILTSVESITIEQGDLEVTLGDDPITLTVSFYPSNATNRGVRWSSSDESVVTVDRNGKLTFVGMGVAVITATSTDGVTDSITVTVMGDWRVLYPNSIFNFGMLDAFFELRDDMLFYPEAEMSRGEAALILSRFYVENPGWTKTGPENFPDLTGEEEYAEAARLLGSLGVMIGVSDGSFAGEQSITRAEFITLLVRMMGLEVPDTQGEEHAFLDSGEEGTWAYSEIDAMYKQTQVIRGTGNGYFAPARKISRAEVASFLTRLLRNPAYKDPKRLRIPKDVGEEHWARNAIVRAVNDTIIPTEE